MGVKVPRTRMDYGALAQEAPGFDGKQTKQPRPKKEIAPVNDERMAERRKLQFGPQSSACRKLPCAACGRLPTKDVPNEAHHVVTRKTGGLDKDTVPLCTSCHRRHDHVGPLTFWSELGLDPEDVVDGMRSWMAAGCPMGRLPEWRAGR